MKFLPSFCPVTLAALLAACAGSPQLAYESAPDEMTESNAVDSVRARTRGRRRPQVELELVRSLIGPWSHSRAWAEGRGFGWIAARLGGAVQT